jgi:hypothetical protein
MFTTGGRPHGSGVIQVTIAKRRVGNAPDESLLVRVSLKEFNFDPVTAIQLPLSERVLDRLGDILFASDEILDMVATQYRVPDDSSREIEACVRRVYNQVNDLMKKLTD